MLLERLAILDLVVSSRQPERVEMELADAVGALEVVVKFFDGHRFRHHALQRAAAGRLQKLGGSAHGKIKFIAGAFQGRRLRVRKQFAGMTELDRGDGVPSVIAEGLEAAVDAGMSGRYFQATLFECFLGQPGPFDFEVAFRIVIGGTGGHRAQHQAGRINQRKPHGVELDVFGFFRKRFPAAGFVQKDFRLVLGFSTSQRDLVSRPLASSTPVGANTARSGMSPRSLAVSVNTSAASKSRK